MPEIPTFDKFMNPVIDVLQELGGTGTIEEINDQVYKRMALRTDLLEVLHNPDKGRMTEVEYRLHWTRTYLKNAGYINNLQRGKWTLTEKGKGVTELDVERIKRDVRMYKSGKSGASVTVPSPQDEMDDESVDDAEEVTNKHTEIQWLLLKLGQDMKLDVWIANNDRSKQFDGNRFDNQPKLLKKLPQRFDPATQRTVELIDVLWLQGQAIAAAFEIENTSSIYSGLLRLSDLTAMQPDMDTPLYIVAPDERQRKVILEINRPTFSKATNLTRRCRYIPYSSLYKAINKAEGMEDDLKPSFIDKFSQHIDSDNLSQT